MFTLNRQSLINPILLSSRIIPDVRVTHRRQFTGGVLRSISSRLSAVDHNVRGLIGQKCRSKLLHLVRRKIDRARQVRVLVSCSRQCLDQQKVVSSFDLGLQFIPRNCRYHKIAPFLISCSVAFNRRWLSLHNSRRDILPLSIRTASNSRKSLYSIRESIMGTNQDYIRTAKSSNDPNH